MSDYSNYRQEPLSKSLHYFFKGLVITIATSIHGSAIADTDQQKQIDVVVTTANRAQTLHSELMGNTSLISQADLAKTDAEHLNQILSQASGTWLSRGNGQESLLSVRSPVLTGAGSCAEFLTLQDGISLRAPGFCNVNQLFDSHFELADSIEVVKGSNSARYGSSAIHGTVNIISPAFEHDSQLSAETGEDHFYRVKGLLTGSSQKANYLVATILGSDGGFQDNSGYQQQKLSLAMAHNWHQWQTTQRFTFSHLAQDTTGFLERGEGAYKDPSLLRINDFPDAYRDSLAMRYVAEHSLQTEDVQWQLTPYLRFTEMDFLMHFLPGTPVEENGHRSLGLQLSRASTFNSHFTLKLGADIDLTHGDLRQTQENPTDHSSAFLSAILPQGKHYDYEVDALNIAAYGEINAQLDGKNKGFFAVRFDHTEYDYANNLSVGNLKEDGSACEFGGCRYTRPASQSNRFSNLSYTMGFSHSLKDDLLIFTKYDDSFRAPHTSELYRLQNGQLVSDVKAVKAKQWELGLRIANFAEKGVFAEASVYRLQKYDGIYQDSDRQFLNGLDSQHQGLEIDLHWQPNDVLSLALAASYANHAYQNNPLNGNEIKDNQIDTAPKLILNAQLTWRVTPDIEMQLESRYLDEYYLDADNSQQYPGHTLYNLRTHWQLHPSVRLSLSVLNLLDTRYAERADFAFGNHRYFVGEPRNLLMKLTYTFD